VADHTHGPDLDPWWPDGDDLVVCLLDDFFLQNALMLFRNVAPTFT
jgi:hypothetical protein